MTTTTMGDVIQMRLAKAEKNPFGGDGVFMHVSAIIPVATLTDVKNQQWEKCSCWHKFPSENTSGICI